jgi:hypothetical protein
MRTVVIPPPGVHGLGRSRTVGVIARPLTVAAALDVLTDLAEHRHLRVAYDVDRRHVVNLWPQQPVTTAEEVAIIGAFRAVTDARLAWHGAVA